jgi:hypothetical protein
MTKREKYVPLTQNNQTSLQVTPITLKCIFFIGCYYSEIMSLKSETRSSYIKQSENEPVFTNEEISKVYNIKKKGISTPEEQIQSEKKQASTKRLKKSQVIFNALQLSTSNRRAGTEISSTRTIHTASNSNGYELSFINPKNTQTKNGSAEIATPILLPLLKNGKKSSQKLKSGRKTGNYGNYSHLQANTTARAHPGGKKKLNAHLNQYKDSNIPRKLNITLPAETDIASLYDKKQKREHISPFKCDKANLFAKELEQIASNTMNKFVKRNPQLNANLNKFSLFTNNNNTTLNSTNYKTINTTAENENMNLTTVRDSVKQHTQRNLSPRRYLPHNSPLTLTAKSNSIFQINSILNDFVDVKRYLTHKRTRSLAVEHIYPQLSLSKKKLYQNIRNLLHRKKKPNTQNMDIPELSGINNLNKIQNQANYE